MSARLQLTPQEVLGSYEGLRLPSLEQNLVMMEGDPSQLAVTAARLATTMKLENLLHAEVKFEQIIDSIHLRKLTKP